MGSISVEWVFSLLCKHQHNKEGGLSAPWEHEKCLVLMLLWRGIVPICWPVNWNWLIFFCLSDALILSKTRSTEKERRMGLQGAVVRSFTVVVWRTIRLLQCLIKELTAILSVKIKTLGSSESRLDWATLQNLSSTKSEFQLNWKKSIFSFISVELYPVLV